MVGAIGSLSPGGQVYERGQSLQSGIVGSRGVAFNMLDLGPSIAETKGKRVLLGHEESQDREARANEDTGKR